MPLRPDLLHPIPGGNPGGENLRSSSLYDKIKEARREDPDLPQGEWQHARKLASWSDVITLTSDALAARSKDLQLAAWLAEALMRREGVAAFPACASFLRELILQFWDALYPELEEGDAELRGAPLDWLGARLSEFVWQEPLTQSGLSYMDYRQSQAMGYEAEDAPDTQRQLRRQLIDEGKIPPEQFDEEIAATPASFYQKLHVSLEAGISGLAQLDACCNERFGEAAPSFRNLSAALEDVFQLCRILLEKKKTALPPATAAQSPEPIPAAPLIQQAVAPAAPPRPVLAWQAATAASAREPENRDEAAERLAAIARWLRARDCYSIDPYLLLRGFRWGELRYNGDPVDSSKLEAPSAALRAELARLHHQQQWKDLIEAAEEAMALPCGRAWLDLQHYVVNALSEESQWFGEIVKAISTELRGLLTDLPSLLHLKLSDGTPAAGAETTAWIRSKILCSANSEISNRMPPPLQEPASPNGNGHAAVDEAFEKALDLVRSGDFPNAIRSVSDELARERTGRGRFQRRMQLARLLMMSGRAHIAKPILEDLAAEIDSRKLEDWEDGDALAYPLTLLFRCASELDAEVPWRLQIYARICRLAPAQAIELQL